MTNLAQNRRDPQKGKKGFSNKGFTVIEMLITVAVLAIIASLALPSYRSIVEKRQVTSAAEQLTAFLSSMKGEAVKLNEDLALSYSTADQCLGFQQALSACDCSADSNSCKVSYDYDRDGTADATVDRAIRYSDFSYPGVVSSIALTNESGADASSGTLMVWDSVRGMLDDGYTEKLSIGLVSASGLYALNVEVDRLGRISICNPATGGEYQVPGYDQCS
jgi:prepilin-type N-terminal cleavage/methylation domain-containing protein